MTLKVTGEQLLLEVHEGVSFSDSTLPDEPLIYVSPSFERLTGYPLGELMGRNCRLLQGADTDSKAVDELRQTIAERRRSSVEILNYRKDGTTFWNHLSLSPVFDSDGKLWHYLGVQADVTERRLREQREREFFDNVSHELKTPITALLGLVETLLRQPYIPAPEARQIHGRLHHQVLHLAHLVESVLSLASVDPLHVAQPHVRLDLRDAMRTALEGVQPAADAAGVRLVAQLGEAEVPVHGSFSGLCTLASNLLDNAVKYSPAGGNVVLALAVAGDAARLTVRDDGPGISAEHQEHVFERFYRVEKSLTASSGAGLGLAIVKEVVDSHGGTVELDTASGRGCTFKVLLPLA